MPKNLPIRREGRPQHFGSDAMSRWEQAFERVERGEMPPADAEQPAADSRRGFLAVLATGTDKWSLIGTTSRGLIWGMLIDLFGGLQEPDEGVGGSVSPCMANNSAGTKLGTASHPQILSQKVATFMRGRSMATLVIDTRSIHVMGECHGSIQKGGGRFAFARVGK